MQRPLAGLTRKNLVRELDRGRHAPRHRDPAEHRLRADRRAAAHRRPLRARRCRRSSTRSSVSSRQLVASPDAAAAALVASSIGGLAVAGSADYATLALAQAILCGIMFLLLAVFKLGFLANFLSKPILVGFVGGLALDILVSQIAKMLGVKIDSGGEFVDKVVEPRQRPRRRSTSWSVLISAASVAVLLARPAVRCAPCRGRSSCSSSRPILVVLADLDDAGVAVLGAVPGRSARRSPGRSSTGRCGSRSCRPRSRSRMVTTAEGLLVSRSYGEKHDYRTSPNRDLFAFGLGNLAAGRAAASRSGSSTSRTAAMDQAGSRTQLPSLVHRGRHAAAAPLRHRRCSRTSPRRPSARSSPSRSCRCSASASSSALWRLDRFEFAHRRRLLPRDAVHRLDPGHPRGLRARARQPRQARREPGDRRARRATASPTESLLEEAPHGSVTAPGVIVVRLAAPLFFANGVVFGDAVKRAVTAAPERHPCSTS